MNTPLKIATWNVNSLRVRLPHVLEWLMTHQPDILCLQETKVLDEDFPQDAIQSAGYEAVFSGQKAYNGVAILSKHPGSEVIKDLPNFEDPQRRILGMTIQDVRVINLYIPNGESIESPKFQYKLNWLERLTHFLANEIKKHPNLIVLGDFNIAPLSMDIHNPEDMVGQLLCSDSERLFFNKMIELGLNDCFRLHPQPEKSYSFWDYRMNSFKRNLGWRIDHILSGNQLSTQCTSCFIDKTPRGLERPSDHAPLVALFERRLA